MIRIEIHGFEDFMMFISLFKHLDDERINELVASLNKSTKTLVQAEKKDAGTSSH